MMVCSLVDRYYHLCGTV